MPQTGGINARAYAWRGPALVFSIWLLACLPFLAGRRFIPFDSIDEFYPISHFVVSSLLHGMAPWWNPIMFGGQPLLADPQSMIFTPNTVVGLLAGSSYNLHVFDFATLGCLLVGGLAVQKYSAAVADRWQFPLLGSAIFMFGGVATSRLQHVPEIVSYSWLPVELLLLRSVALSGKISHAFALAAVFTLTLLNANQVLFLSIFGLAPLALLHCAQSPRRLRAICLIACAAIVALILASPMLAATLEFLRLSNRPSLPLAASNPASLPFHVLASLVLPGLYGVAGPVQAIWTPTDITQDYLYVGVVPLLVLGFSSARLRTLSAESKLCLAMMLIWFLFAMGMRTPFYRALFLHVPGFASFRRPADGAFLLNFFVALFVAQVRISGARIRAGAAVFAAFVVLVLVARAVADAWAFAALFGHVGSLVSCLESLALRLAIAAAFLPFLLSAKPVMRSIGGTVLLAAAIIDLLSAARFGPIYAPRTASFENAVLYSQRAETPKLDGATGKTIAFLKAQQALAGGAGWRIEAIGGNLAGAMPMAFGLATTKGYDPVLSARYAQLIGSENLQQVPKHFTEAAPNYDASLYRRLGLRFVVLNKTIVQQAAGFGTFGAITAKLRHDLETGGYAQLVDASGGYEVWELRNALPRATLVPEGAETGDATQSPGSCSVVSYAPADVRVHCQSDGPAQLVLGDNAAPGWFACVNGAPATISIFDGLFRAVPVPAGESNTLFRYQPLPFFRSRRCAS